MKPVIVHASLPPIQSAIKIGQDSMRVQFDIPAIDMGEGVNLTFFQGRPLKLTVEIDTDEPEEGEARVRWDGKH